MIQVLQRPTLVLNRNWQAVHIATVARALVMLYRGAARVVDPRDYQTYDWDDWALLRPAEGDAFVQGVTLQIRVPEVVTLTEYDAVPSASVAFSRRNIFERDKFTCVYCGVQPGTDELTIDHVVPRAHGGQSTWDNCVLACLSCNHRKADRTPEQAGIRLRKQPQRPAWKPVYAMDSVPIESWTKFVSEAYWNVELTG
jgi:5-methylcytosine-specific restriction endonuclease McrA